MDVQRKKIAKAAAKARWEKYRSFGPVKPSEMDMAVLLPQPGDVLFPALDPIVLQEEGSWLSYARAYKSAADKLVTSWDAGVQNEDAPFPIVFLYRHYLELELKSIVALDCVRRAVQDAEADDVENEKTIEAAKAKGLVREILNSHDLLRLCERCREAATRAQLMHGKFVPIFDAFERLVSEMASHDAGSDSFRYPLRKNLEPVLPILEIDLPRLKVMFDKIGNLTAVVRHAIEQHLEWLDRSYDWTDEDNKRDRKDYLGIDEAEAQREAMDE